MYTVLNYRVRYRLRKVVMASIRMVRVDGEPSDHYQL